MFTPILATKLYIPPPPPQIIRRPRLINRLNQGLPHRKLTLISAAAGFGKTTLLSEWINEQDEGVKEKTANSIHPSQVAWLSLDEGDNELTRFLAYLIAAFQTIAPTVGEETLAMLQSPPTPATELILTTLLNEITAVSRNFILVLDDYHLIDTPAIDKAITFLLDHQPPQMHLVIATREDPSLPLARYRARGHLTELRAADLRFTPAETAGFLNQTMHLNLSEANISALEARTEGWVAGLQLAALALQGQQKTDSFIQTFTGSHHFVLDYLIEEVLHQQPEQIQTFLLCTSILDRLCGPLCDAVLDDAHLSGQQILVELERANLFIIPLDSERRWYRYHHLFGDLLRQRVQQNPPNLPSLPTSETIKELHRRASVWYEEEGMEAEAVHHALAGKDFSRTASLLEQIWPAMDNSFQTATWLEWAKKLPEDMLHLRPVLMVDYACALLDNGHIETGKSYLQAAEQLLNTITHHSIEPVQNAKTAVSSPNEPNEVIIVDEKQFRLLPATITTAYGYHAQVNGDSEAAIKYSRQTLDLLPEDEQVKRILAAGFLATSYWAHGDLDTAHHTFIELITKLRNAGHIVFATATTYGLSIINIARGYLFETIQIYKQAIQLAQEQGDPPIQGLADQFLWLCDLYLEQGRLAAAKQQLANSEELGKRAALPDWVHRLHLAQAKIKEAEGDLEDALERLDKAQAAYYPVPVPPVQPVEAKKARIWLKQGKLSKAQGWAKAQNLSSDDDLSYLCEFEYITLARIKIMEGENGRFPQALQEAADLLTRLHHAAADGKRHGSMIEILVLQAITHQAQDNISQALESLEQALTLAAPENYVRVFVDEGPQMAKLLKRQIAEGKNQKEFAQKLLATLNNQEPIQQSSVSSHQSLVEPLSEREVEVLQLVAEGFSNREISEQLHLALSTVKGHNMRIFGKLGVQRRTEAVARARELGLL